MCLETCTLGAKSIDEVAKIYETVTGFNIEISDIPEKICDKCYDLIFKVEAFHERALNTETVLAKHRESVRLTADDLYVVTESNDNFTHYEADAEKLIYFEQEALEDDDARPGDEILEEFFHIPNTNNPNGPKRKQLFRKVVCDECGKTVLKCRMNLHKRLSHAKIQVRFQCDFCGVDYKLKDDLRRHMLKIHLKRKDFQCKYCGKLYKDWNALNYHTQKQHEPHRLRFECETCHKRFFNNYELKDHKDHKATHLGMEFNSNFLEKK